MIDKYKFFRPWLAHRPVKGLLDNPATVRNFHIQAKIDGHRAMLVHHPDGAINVWSRSGKEARWPAFMYKLASVLPLGTYLDGELFPNETRCLLPPPFLSSTVGHLRTADPASLDYYVFDILYCAGQCQIPFPYHTRWVMVNSLVKDYQADFPQLRVPLSMRQWLKDEYKHFGYVTPREFMDYVLEQGFEGVMMKSRMARYASGSRSLAAIKFKQTRVVTVLVTDMDSKPTPWRVRPGAVDKQTGKVSPQGVKTGPAQNGWCTLSYGYWDPELDMTVRVGSLGISGSPEILEKEINRRYDIKVWGVNNETGALRHPVYQADRTDEISKEEVTLESIVNGW